MRRASCLWSGEESERLKRVEGFSENGQIASGLVSKRMTEVVDVRELMRVYRQLCDEHVVQGEAEWPVLYLELTLSVSSLSCLTAYTRGSEVFLPPTP